MDREAVVKVNPLDFDVTTPSGDTLNFDSRIGLSKAKHGIAAFNTVVPMRVVVIDGREKGKEMLGSFIHEASHSAFVNLEEPDIIKLEHFLRDVLWSAGYRRNTEKKHGGSLQERRSGRGRNA
jgi:hypothetical protein